MHIIYIDESGNTAPITQQGSKFLVLTGAIFHENQIRPVEEKFREIKQRYYQDPEIEIKSNFLRYANPDLTETSPLKLNSRQKYNELEDEITSFLKNVPVDIVSVAIEKEAYWQQYPSQSPYEIAYVFLLERFQKYLVTNNSLGISIIDPREGQVDKHFIGNELDSIHRSMRWRDSVVWKPCPNIVEKLLFSQSDKTIGIQIADLFCYPIFNVLEYNKSQNEYWRYTEISSPKLIKSPSGKADGWGLKIFPDSTKKSLRLFS